ncbi:hypothetical protein ETB97_006201 [Aspergillus alliaceus]|uniref:Uncharacterized protein n=1 Tax=Petromyces alliaceus TaxID=209559 RepID=A0A8H5ZWS8_PETAA|nr:hypothetical protein ETB97_006201 [Aspergillus burnettii]
MRQEDLGVLLYLKGSEWSPDMDALGGPTGGVIWDRSTTWAWRWLHASGGSGTLGDTLGQDDREPCFLMTKRSFRSPRAAAPPRL